MSKRIYISLLFFFTGMFLTAQTPGGPVEIHGLEAFETEDGVTVSFTARIAPDAVGPKETLIFAPVLTDGQYRVSLPPVKVEGGKSRIRRERRTWATAGETGSSGKVYVASGEKVEYRETIEAQEWMHGGEIWIEGSREICTVSRSENPLLIAGELKLYDDPQPVEMVTEIRRFRPKSVADSLSMIFPFVLPESLFDPEDPYKIYDEERDHSMILYFRVARKDIDKSYRDNAQVLTNLVAAVDMILGETDCRVERVVVAGFASPEGNFEQNDRLAFDRAVAVKHQLLLHTALEDEQVWIHNGSADWRGLRLLVQQSDMTGKEKVVEIIEQVPARDANGKPARLEALRKLDNGAAYDHLLREFFPLLRNGAFIKVYYTNTRSDVIIETNQYTTEG